MPVVRAREAKNNKDHAAIENKLFFNDKTRMLFGDAKSTLQALANEVKDF